MKTVKKYLDEVSGIEFKTPKEAQDSEKRHRSLRSIFSWVNDAEKKTKTKNDGSCDFANGSWCVQRDQRFYERLQDCVIEAVNRFEPWISEEYKKHGGLKREYVSGLSILGRYLESSPVDHWHRIIATICPKCYRQYGQPYFALNCNHNGTAKSSYSDKPQDIPTRNI